MSLRNAEVVQAMGMLPGLLKRWNRDRFRAILGRSHLLMCRSLRQSF